MRSLAILTAMVTVVAIVAGLGLQQAQAVVLFEENFDYPTGELLSQHGYTTIEYPSMMVSDVLVDSGNSGSGYANWATAAGTDLKDLPGGEYTLGAGEYFRLTYKGAPEAGYLVYGFAVANGWTTPERNYLQLSLDSDGVYSAYSSAQNDNTGNTGAAAPGWVRAEFDGSHTEVFHSPDGSSWTSGGENLALGGWNTVSQIFLQVNGTTSGMDSFLLEVIPEPATSTMLLIGLVGLIPVAWRRRRSR